MRVCVVMMGEPGSPSWLRADLVLVAIRLGSLLSQVNILLVCGLPFGSPAGGVLT